MAAKKKKRAVPASKRYLVLRGQTWWAKINIPQDCRDALGGKTASLRSMETADVRVAQVRRDVFAAEIQQAFSDIRAGRFVSIAAPAHRGEYWRDELARTEEEHGPDTEGWHRALGGFSRELKALPTDTERFAFTNAFIGKVPLRIA